jgi:hypothetical protein
MPGTQSTAAIFAAAQGQLGLTDTDVWLAYLGVGGNASRRQVRTWFTGAVEPGDHDHDLIAQVFNDRFLEEGMNHPVAYATD